MPKIINLKKKDKKQTKDRLEWTALEFAHYKKSKSWFITICIAAGIFFLWAIFTKNILFAMLVILGLFSIIAHAIKTPRNIHFAITFKGVKIDKTLYAFDNLKSFWIFYDPPEVKEISLRSKKTIMPYIKIPLGKQNPVKIRQLLIKYIPEKKHKESLIDNLTRQLRF